MPGYIKLYREIREHWIYKNSDYLKVWIEMLTCGRYLKEPKTDIFDGIVYTINYAEFIFGRPSWSVRLNVSEQKLRILIRKLISANMIVCQKKHSKFTVYKIVNYEKYSQLDNHVTDIERSGECGESDQQENQQRTSREPAENQQRTTIKKVQEGCKKEKKEEKEDIYSSVIGYLNEKAGTAYKPSSQKTRGLIQARVNEDFTLQDFYKVIDKKTSEWMNTEWQKFLRPETLFSNKFEGYLNQRVSKKPGLEDF